MIGEEFIAILIAGLACGFVDASLGMGYGVTSATVLISFGIAPAVASASVHTAEAFVDIVSGGFHLKFGNVNREMLSPLLVCGTLGAILGAASLSYLTIKAAKPIISLALLCMGLIVLIKFLFKWKKRNKNPNSRQKTHSKRRLSVLGFVAGFIDSSCGGGWGPILTPAFVATNSNPRKAIGTVEFTEPIVSIATTLTFGFLIGFESFLWNIVLPMIIGGIILSPIAAYVCKKMPRRLLGIAVGVWVSVLNARTLAITW